MHNDSEVTGTMEKGFTEAGREWMRHRAAGTTTTPEGLAAFDAVQLASETLAGETAARGGGLALCGQCGGLFNGATGGKLCERCFAVDQLLATSADLFDRIRRALARWQSPGERALAQSSLVG